MITPPSLTRAEQLVAVVERRISHERLTPGTFLGTRESLREESGLAKSTVNEAVRLLSDRGVVTVKPGRGGGLFVADVDSTIRLRHTLLTVAEGADDVAGAIVVRDALEPLVAADAARNRTADDVRRLRTLAEQLRACAETSDPQEFVTVNWRLHEAIAAITPSAYLHAVYLATVRTVSGSTMGARLDHRRQGSDYLTARARLHDELVEAIASGDLKRVNRAVRQHARGG